VEDLLRDQQLPPGVDPPHPMSVPFIQATGFDNSALPRVNRNILPGYCHCRHSSANVRHVIFAARPGKPSTNEIAPAPAG
jgi:hypothetical protein